MLVPERDKVFPNLTVAENLAAPFAPSLRERREPRGDCVYQFFPRLADLRSRIGGLLSGGERQMLALGERAGLPAGAAAGRRTVARPRAGRGRGPDGARSCEIRRELGITIVMVEQSAAVALEIADYGYVLENGRVVLDGDGRRACAPTATSRNSISAKPQDARAAAIATSSNIAGPGGGMAELEIDALSLRFGGLVVLDGVSLSVERGELLALIGPNGAGKTSVFNCISGIYRGEGAIRFRGEDISATAPHDIARLGIARTFQHGELFPQMTVVDNLLDRPPRAHPHAIRSPRCCSCRACAREEMRQREAVEKIIEFVELERYRHAPVGGLPFGTQKIVGFARALALEPALLLLDEPSAGLNREEREDLARFILRIKHQLGIAMIWIEHDMQMVADLADRIHVLDYGRTLAAGLPDDVLRRPEVVEAYLGRGG